MRALTLFEAYVKATVEVGDITFFDPTLKDEENLRHFDRRDRLLMKLEDKIRERLSAPPLCWGCKVALDSYMEEYLRDEDTWLDVTEKEPR